MKVSVVVIAYNKADCISDCIKSILNQPYKNFELIIVDDYSFSDFICVSEYYSVI